MSELEPRVEDADVFEEEYYEQERGAHGTTLLALSIVFGAGFFVVLAFFVIYYFNTKPKLEELRSLKLAAAAIDESAHSGLDAEDIPPPGVEIIITPRIDRIEAYAESQPTTFGSYEPSKMLDGDKETAWSAEYKEGEDAWLAVYLREEAAIAAISLVPGFSKTTHEKYGNIFKLNYRIKEVDFEFPDGTAVSHKFEDSPALQSVPVQPPVTCEEFKIKIKSVYPTGKWNDVSISELEVSGPE